MTKNIKKKIFKKFDLKRNIESKNETQIDSRYRDFINICHKYSIPEISHINSSFLTEEFITSVFLKYIEIRDEYIETRLPNFPYLKSVEDLEDFGFNINYFLSLDSTKKETLIAKKMLLLQDKKGKIWLGMYNPSVFIDFDFDDMFIFGNSVYNYFFGKNKDLDFLSSNFSLENILQYMESNNINDIGIDPINNAQYIMTAEISKKNVLLTQRPILKDSVVALFHNAMNLMNIDYTTEFPTTTGLLKIDLVGKGGVYVKRTFRINFIKVKAGYTASIRRFMNYDEIASLGLEGLGYTDEAIELINSAIESKTGINMILGETNSGKSTLLAAILNKIYMSQEKIISIENPIEIEMPYLQIDLSDTETADEKFKMTKEVAQKGILRHNPNVVLMSEIRTHDEIDFFAGLGLRGHMALATLHAGSVENAIEILLKVADESEINSILNIFVHQELLAKKCSKCDGSGEVGGHICTSCNGNKSKGVVPIYEIIKFGKLDKDDNLRDLDSLVEKRKAKIIRKSDLIEKLYNDGLIFEKDYKRVKS